MISPYSPLNLAFTQVAASLKPSHTEISINFNVNVFCSKMEIFFFVLNSKKRISVFEQNEQKTEHNVFLCLGVVLKAFGW